MSDMPKIKVLYTCNQCGLLDRAVSIIERGVDEPIEAWMRKVQVALSEDHDRTSPHCRITSFTNTKIPLAHSSNIIGRAERH